MPLGGVGVTALCPVGCLQLGTHGCVSRRDKPRIVAHWRGFPQCRPGLGRLRLTAAPRERAPAPGVIFRQVVYTKHPRDAGGGKSDIPTLVVCCRGIHGTGQSTPAGREVMAQGVLERGGIFRAGAAAFHVCTCTVGKWAPALCQGTLSDRLASYLCLGALCAGCVVNSDCEIVGARR
jgi:hypothetical protein